MVPNGEPPFESMPIDHFSGASYLMGFPCAGHVMNLSIKVSSFQISQLSKGINTEVFNAHYDFTVFVTLNNRKPEF